LVLPLLFGIGAYLEKNPFSPFGGELFLLGFFPLPPIISLGSLIRVNFGSAFPPLFPFMGIPSFGDLGFPRPKGLL